MSKRHLLVMVLFSLVAVACSQKENNGNSVQAKASTVWSVTSHRYMTKYPETASSRYLALPVAPKSLFTAFRAVKKCDTVARRCRYLHTKAIVFNKDGEVKLVKFVFFHHSEGYATPSVVQRAFAGREYLAWSCNMHTWPPAMKARALYQQGEGSQQVVELPTSDTSFTYGGKRYWWYEFRKTE